MAFWSEPPELDLRDTVARWCYSTGEGLSLPCTIRVEPDGRADLVVAVAAGPASMGQRPCRAEVFGMKSRPLAVTTCRPTETIAVQFRPGAWARLFGVSADALTDRSCGVGDLWGRAGYDWIDRISGAATPAERKQVIAATLRERLAQSAGGDPGGGLVRAAVALIGRSRGGLSVARVARLLDVHPRRLERVFKQEVGLSPKRYARGVRFSQAKLQIAQGKPLVAVAGALGFADQAHLCREFKAWSGRTPRSPVP